MIVYTFEKQVRADWLHTEISNANIPNFLYVETIDGTVYIHCSDELNTEDLQSLTSVVDTHSVTNVSDTIQSRLRYYQAEAGDLIVDLYTQNTLNGITVSESDEMFTAFADVLLRLREGAWPTALYRLHQKQPDGFVTQEMINSWISLIESRML